MKKTYMTPKMEQKRTRMEVVVPMCASRVSSNGGGVNSGYGGVDISGSRDPAAKEREADDFYDELW